MIAVQIRFSPGSSPPLSWPLHVGLTVVAGLDRSSRRQLASGLAAVLGGRPAGVEIEIEVNGEREWLTAEVATRLGLEANPAKVVVEPAALPGAAKAPGPEPGDRGPGADPAAGAAQEAAAARVAEAEEGLAQAQAVLAEAEAEARLAGADQPAAAEGPDDGGGRSSEAAVGEAKGRLDLARQELQQARDALAEAEASTAAAAKVEGLMSEQAELEEARAELVARLAETSAPTDPAPLQQALTELRRVRAVKPEPSAAAARLAERWAEITKRLADLPAPPEPPEWLVAPAMAALQEAREALSRIDGAGRDPSEDAELVEALDRAHRQVLDAEQKLMRKGSRAQRRRVEHARQAEQEALLALGVATYGEYLQRVAPGAAPSVKDDERLAAARAALADAEAVWEELHGGLASPEWTAAKAEAADVRAQAHELLGRAVPDAELEAALRDHHDEVVDVEGAEQSLADALVVVAGETSLGPDLEAAAQQWLDEEPVRSQARAELEAELARLDGRLATVGADVAEHQADAFFGADGSGSAPDGGGGPGAGTGAAQARVDRAEEEEREAQAALERAEQRAAADLDEQRRRAERDRVAQAARQTVRAAEAALGEARLSLEAARVAAAAAAPAPPTAESLPPGELPEPDLGAVTAVEAQVYLLACLAAVQGVPQGPLPLFVDAAAVAGLAEGPAGRVLALLERVAGGVQVVLLGDDGPVGEWARSRGDRAAVVVAMTSIEEHGR